MLAGNFMIGCAKAVLIFALLILVGSVQAQTAPASLPVDFASAVQPIFTANCIGCHGAETRVKELNLAVLEGVLKGSESGPVVVPGKPDDSRLYQLVRDAKMPPGKKHLDERQVASIRSWIESLATSPAHAALAAEEVTEPDIVAIMYLRCTVCHGLRRREAGLDLRTRAGMLSGGKSGPAVIPGDPDKSPIVKLIESGAMPPKKELMDVSIKVITPFETEKLKQWIKAGAPESHTEADAPSSNPDTLVSDKDRQWWAFQTPRKSPVPAVKENAKVRNPIDAFLLAKLQEKGLTLAPEASKLTLMRRAYFDLTGLPPEPSDVRAFLTDRDPAAYEKMIDRLLESPRYGERWGRHWLDVAGYSDSEGGKLTDDVPRTNAWRYRDYVIRAFNADKPYNRFLMEQIAGDELADYENASVVTEQMVDNIVATGFLRMGPDSTIEHNISFTDDRLEVIGDEIDVLGSSVMGLTIKCARCHSHKYDPIPQRDYYRLKAVFQGAYDEHDWLSPHPSVYDDLSKFRFTAERYLPYVPPGATTVQILEARREADELNHNLSLQILNLKTALDEKSGPLKKKIVAARLAQQPQAIREDLQKVLDTPPDKQTEVQKYLASKFEKVLKVEPEELRNSDPEYRKVADETDLNIKKLEYAKAPDSRIRALWDRGEPSPTYIQKRGEPSSFGRMVGPGVPSCLTDGKTPFVATAPWPGAKKTGRRLAFAKWLIEPSNPLTARVMVNRMWQNHFGTGIVKTLGNFGKAGIPPSNQELLDWLATEFVDRGWSVKSMHRLMMTSAAYRQSSAVNPAVEKADPDNKLVSRMPMRRMEAEVIYDTMLLVSHKLDENRFGPPEPIVIHDDGLVRPLGTDKGWHRGIYVEQRRTKLPTMMESFDLPAMAPNCLERASSTIAPQALNMMNDGMIAKLADSFAERIEREAGTEPGERIEQAYWIALSRPPADDEKKVGLEALRNLSKVQKPDGALRDFCLALMNSAPFVFID